MTLPPASEDLVAVVAELPGGVWFVTWMLDMPGLPIAERATSLDEARTYVEAQWGGLRWAPTFDGWAAYATGPNWLSKTE